MLFCRIRVYEYGSIGNGTFDCRGRCCAYMGKKYFQLRRYIRRNGACYIEGAIGAFYKCTWNKGFGNAVCKYIIPDIAFRVCFYKVEACSKLISSCVPVYSIATYSIAAVAGCNNICAFPLQCSF